MKVCSCVGCGAHPGSCPAIVAAGRCPNCSSTADRARGTATDRGYTGAGHRAFRTAVLARDPKCVICKTAPSTVADHYPVSRRDLVDQGRDPNDPAAGRGACAACHGTETTRHQPGGFLVR